MFLVSSLTRFELIFEAVQVDATEVTSLCSGTECRCFILAVANMNLQSSFRPKTLAA